jgi:hypothetical protein
MQEQIVYVIESEPGGIDGKDPSDKGAMIAAMWYRDEAEARFKNDKRYRIRPIIVDVDETCQNALKKLNAVERLCLGLTK